jgi:hypothetical protein
MARARCPARGPGRRRRTPSSALLPEIDEVEQALESVEAAFNRRAGQGEAELDLQRSLAPAWPPLFIACDCGRVSGSLAQRSIGARVPRKPRSPQVEVAERLTAKLKSTARPSSLRFMVKDGRKPSCSGRGFMVKVGPQRAPADRGGGSRRKFRKGVTASDVGIKPRRRRRYSRPPCPAWRFARARLQIVLQTAL